MKCFLCDFNSMNDDKIKIAKEALQKLKDYYISFHLIDKNNYYFKELFTPSTVSKQCDQCKMAFRNYMVKISQFHTSLWSGRR